MHDVMTTVLFHTGMYRRETSENECPEFQTKQNPFKNAVLSAHSEQGIHAHDQAWANFLIDGLIR